MARWRSERSTWQGGKYATLDRFVAHTQADEWEGTAAAEEDVSGDGISRLMYQRGLLNPEKDFVAAVSLRLTAEGRKPRTCSLTAFVAARPKKTPWAVTVSNQRSPLHVREVAIEDLSLADFFCLFKRSNIILTRNHCNLVGRPFAITSE
jgi:hypothetical protein